MWKRPFGLSTTNTDQHAAFMATEYIIAALRTQLDLWCDTNDGWYFGNCLNNCFLTDGESYLNGAFTSISRTAKPSHGLVVQSSYGTINVKCNLRSDSRLRRSTSELYEVVRDAAATFDRLDPRDFNRCSVALISMQIEHDETSNRTEEWLDELSSCMNAKHRDCPEYNGTWREEPGFSMEDMPSRRWTQMEFSKPMDKAAVIDVVLNGFQNAKKFELGTNHLYKADSDIEERFGITDVHVFGRMF